MSRLPPPPPVRRPGGWPSPQRIRLPPCRPLAGALHLRSSVFNAMPGERGTSVSPLLLGETRGLGGIWRRVQVAMGFLPMARPQFIRDWRGDSWLLNPSPGPRLSRGIRLGKGAPRRLTLASGGIADWIVDASGYHPTTKGGKQIVHEQIAEDIKRHLFGDPDSESQLEESRLHAADSKLPWIGCWRWTLLLRLEFLLLRNPELWLSPPWVARSNLQQWWRRF